MHDFVEDQDTEDLRILAHLLLTLSPTSASGERAFKQRSPVHSNVPNKLSHDKTDKQSAIDFNNAQNKRYLEGHVMSPRTSAVVKVICCCDCDADQYCLSHTASFGGAAALDFEDACSSRSLHPDAQGSSLLAILNNQCDALELDLCASLSRQLEPY